MDATGIEGCCVVTNLYNLGGAHSIHRAKSQRDFNNNLRQIRGRLSRHIVCYTNNQQSVERRFLQTAQFDTEPFGTIYLHKIVRDKLDRYLAKTFKEDNKSLEEELKDQLDLIKEALKSPFRKPKPPYTLKHWEQFFQIVNPEFAKIRGSYLNHSRYNNSKSEYQYVAGTIDNHPLPHKQLVEAYFQVKIPPTYNYNSIYLLAVPEFSDYNRNNCLLNCINAEYGLTLDEYK